MPKKSAILNNVTEYSPEDLASYIQQGIVTFEELRNNTEGEFTAKMQLDVEKLLAGNEDGDFQTVMESNSIADCRIFLISIQWELLRIWMQSVSVSTNWRQHWLQSL